MGLDAFQLSIRLIDVSGNEPNLVDLGFMDARIKLIDIAAFLDRLDRHGQADDYRVRALREAFSELDSKEPGRASRVLGALSDHTEEPIDAADMQGAFGAPPEIN